MRCCIISANNITFVPYFQFYKRILEKYDIIIWNRSDIKEDIGAEHEFVYKSRNKFCKKKYSDYFRFFMYTIYILMKERYDLIIFLHSQVGVILSPILEKFYKRRYICDIRDYEYEDKMLYRYMEKIFVNNSAINIISSSAYKKFLPKGKYFVLHNDREVPNEKINKFRERSIKETIVIGNIGTFRFKNQNEKLIQALANDNRFHLNIYGQGAEILKDYCEINYIQNVSIMDRFDPAKTMDYFSECDIIFNLYGNKTPHLDYALSNKLYIAARFGMPILVCPDTYMEKIACKFGIGIVVDLEKDDVKNQILIQYNQFRKSDFRKKCDRFLGLVEYQNKLTILALKNVINKLD